MANQSSQSLSDKLRGLIDGAEGDSVSVVDLRRLVDEDTAHLIQLPDLPHPGLISIPGLDSTESWYSSSQMEEYARLVLKPFLEPLAVLVIHTVHDKTRTSVIEDQKWLHLLPDGKYHLFAIPISRGDGNV